MFGKVENILPPSFTIQGRKDEEGRRFLVTVEATVGAASKSHTFEVPLDQSLMKFGQDLLGVIKWVKENAEKGR